MKKSIQDSPEMLELRELIVYPYPEGRFVVVCGNLRLRACKELGYTELPCKVLDVNTPTKKLREYASKDNVSFGENDQDIIENEWDKSELPYIPSFPSTTRSTSFSSYSHRARLTRTGCVNV